MVRRWSAPLVLALSLTACGSDEAAAPISRGVPGTSAAFDLSADTNTPEGFFAQPYPSDLRLDARGRPALGGMPNPSNNPTLSGLLEIAGDRPGFPVVPVAWFRFDAPIGERGKELIAPEPSSPILLIDVDETSPERGRLFPLVAPTVRADELYAPENLLAVSAFPGVVLHPKRRYAFVVRRSLGDAGGSALGVPPDLDDLMNGRTPAGASGEAARANFAPLLATLDTLGIAHSEVASASVFTTGDVVAELAKLATTMVERYDVVPQGLRVDPVDGTTHQRFCEVLATVSYPQFQRGTPPFDSDGLFEVDADGTPVKQRDESAPITITLPKAPMPPGGYPLVMYFHGSGGLSSAAVDMGRDQTPGEDDPVPGTGPAHYLSPHGFATVASALPLNPERLPGAGELAYLNFDNLKAFRDTFRQGVIEQHLLIEALGALRIDPAAVASCTGLSLPSGETQYRLRTETLYAQGQSMGGMYTNMIGATHPRITAVVPTGAGGFWSKFIPETKLVGNLGSLAAVIMGLSIRERLEQWHPTLHVLQTGWEPAEPMVYMPRLARRPLPDHPVRSIYEPIAKDDSYFPTTLYDAIVIAYGHPQAGDAVWPSMQEALKVVGLDGLRSYPVADNLRSERDDTPYTGIAVQYLADAAYDPHSIYRQLDSVKHQYGCFFESFLVTGKATVPAPAPLGTPCPR